MKNEKKRQQTRDKMKTALIRLCTKKSYSQITVNDICQEAGVYRSTFYRYYDSTDEMLREIERDYLKNLRALVPTIISIPYSDTSEMFKKYRTELVKDLKYHQAHREEAHFLLSPDGDYYFARMLYDSVEKVCTENMKKQGINVNRDQQYQITFFIEGYFGVIKRWVRLQDCSAEHEADLIMNMIRRYRLFDPRSEQLLPPDEKSDR